MTRFFSQYYRPSAGGSGIPELIGFLNGTVVRHIFNFKTMLVKFFSCVCAVGAGLPIGPEGPMIHLGYVAHMLLILSNLSFDHIPVVFVTEIKRHEVSDHSTTAMFNQQQRISLLPRM